MPFNHSFLSGGIDFCVFLNKFSYQPSLLYQSMLLGGGRCCMSNIFFYYPALLCHSIRLEKLLYPYSPLWEGIDFISIYTYISFKNLFYHPSCFSHSKLQKNAIGSLISFLKGLISLYFSIVSSVIVHCSINPCFWEGVDVACQTFLFFILHCSVIPYY